MHAVLVAQDNYVWLLHESGMGKTAVVDPSEAAPVIKALDEQYNSLLALFLSLCRLPGISQLICHRRFVTHSPVMSRIGDCLHCSPCRGLKADYILNTHHHFDHTGGNLELKQRYGATIVGPAADKDRIPGIDISLKDGDTWKFGQLEMRVFDTPGHTRGHITLHFPEAEALFPGTQSLTYFFAAFCSRFHACNRGRLQVRDYIFAFRCRRHPVCVGLRKVV